jgi:hypothetical protein
MNQAMPRKDFFRFRSVAVAVSVVVGAMALSGAMASKTAQAGELVFKCEGLEEKSPYTAFGTRMYQGHDGWFFRQGDFETLFELPPETLELLSRVSDVLDYHGVHLILLPMLPRAIAGSEFVPNSGMLSDIIYDPNLAAQQFDSLFESIRQKGVDAVNINTVLKADASFDKGTYYFKRDIHWTPEGARLVAAAVAEHINGQQKNVKKVVEFETTEEPATQLHKANFNGILNELCQSKIPPEEVRIFDTKQKVDSLDDLLGDQGDDVGEPVHVVGSSYTDDVTAYNFDGFLRQFLRQNVGGFSVSGGGVDESIYAWAQNPSGLGKKPKFLVWEFPDLVDLRKLTRSMNEAIVPAIMGDCANNLKVAELAFGEDDTFELDLPGLKGNAADYYLRYELDHKALTRFQLKYTYGDGSHKTVPFENPSRVSGLTKIYQTLPDGTAPVHVSLKIGDGAKSAGSVKLCRYPDGAFQSAATSN